MIQGAVLIPKVAYAESLQNPLRATNLRELLLNVAQILIEFGIPIAAIFIIYSGVMFVTARGNEQQIERAKKNIWWTIVGTAILVGVWVILRLIIGTIESLR